MLRSLSAAVSGLRNQQTRMDVIGNNVSNVNTTAFKSGRVTFKEGFAQLVESASRPTDGVGGTNAMQVGLGSQIGSIDTIFTQGNLETTGRNLDLAIQGSSFFVLKKGNESFYTRDGNLQVDANGTLVAGADGYRVQGRMATNGVLSDVVGDLKIPVLQTSPANPTTKVTLSGNVDASAQVFDQGAAATLDPLDPAQRALPQNANSFKDMSITVYDSLGTKHELKMVMWKTDVNQWDWKFDDSNMDISAAGITESAGTHPITFAADGSVDLTATAAMPTVTFTPNSGGSDVTIALDLGSGMNGLSQFAGSSTAVMRDQDGYTNGTLQDFTIDASGTIVGGFTNGITQVLGQLQLADFNNAEGLSRTGDNAYTVTANSGAAVLGFAGEGSTSSIASGSLEMSNVDLAQEFTNMIVAQRGFQANSRVITTTDQLMQELVDIKR
jgi:flagellar hook protein FlgE